MWNLKLDTSTVKNYNDSVSITIICAILEISWIRRGGR